MRIAWRTRLQQSPDKCLDESGGFNLLLAFGLLGVIVVDTFIGYHDNLFHATSEEDQISIVVFLFVTVGYFMLFGMVDTCLADNYGKHGRSGRFFYGKMFQLVLVLGYVIRWWTMYPDDWNPAVYYMPEFYQYSLIAISVLLFVHLAQVGISCHVLLKDRNLQFSGIGTGSGSAKSKSLFNV